MWSILKWATMQMEIIVSRAEYNDYRIKDMFNNRGHKSYSTLSLINDLKEQKIIIDKKVTPLFKNLISFQIVQETLLLFRR